MIFFFCIFLTIVSTNSFLIKSNHFNKLRVYSSSDKNYCLLTQKDYNNNLKKDLFDFFEEYSVKGDLEKQQEYLVKISEYLKIKTLLDNYQEELLYDQEINHKEKILNLYQTVLKKKFK
jgi:ABC-type phosphate/phosphonate transport system substrate-binding protein